MKATGGHPEWYPYRVQYHPPTKNWIYPDCQELETVYHVAHVPDACRILDDREIKAGLIGDESHLRETRTTVAWFSANTWNQGSIYGNVQFAFSWDELIEGKNIYWVEVMTAYNPSAYRFLITAAKPHNLRRITPYDPTTDEGPLRKIKGRWYWNGRFTSEFMIDMNVTLRGCQEVTFIKHSLHICRLHGPQCSGRARPYFSSGAQVLAYVISNDMTYISKRFLAEKPRGRYYIDYVVQDSLECLLMELAEDNKFGGPLKAMESRAAALKGALSLYGVGLADDARQLINLFNSFIGLKRSLEEMTNDYLKVTDLTIPKPCEC
jgi:hypothetical protein